MNEKKFKGYSKVHGLSSSETLKHWMCYGSDLLLKYDTFIQYLGYSDSEGIEVFEGDVLELKITEDLINNCKNTFFTSNLGKAITKLGNVTSVILVHTLDKKCMTMKYEVYFSLNNKVERDEENNPTYSSWGCDEYFPQYLVQYGAKVIGNILVDEDILNKM